jgi:CheY-like chemotaxis protein
MRSSGHQADGALLLLADDDDRVRTLFAALLRTTPGIGTVVEAGDGEQAVDVACEQRVDIAVLDLIMPRLDGVEVAAALRCLQPSLPIALHSSDPERLRRRAEALDLPLFDKLDFDRLLEWVAATVGGGDAARAPTAEKRDLCCTLCGYGIVSRALPARCPMCGGDARWTQPAAWSSRRASLHQRLAS